MLSATLQLSSASSSQGVRLPQEVSIGAEILMCRFEHLLALCMAFSEARAVLGSAAELA